MTCEELEETEKAEFCDRIHLLANRIADEIRGHQQLVAVEANKLKLDIKRIKTGIFLQSLNDLYHRANVLESRHIAIAEDSVDVEIETDSAILGRVVGNMLKNAIEASAPGERVTLESLFAGSARGA